MSNASRPFWKVLLIDKTSLKFSLGVIAGLSFSIAVILSTVGIMDGFVFSLKRGLKKSVGDMYLYSRSGFFHMTGKPYQKLKKLGITEISPLIQTEGFLISGNNSKGVQLKGIDNESFSKVTGVNFSTDPRTLTLGSELLKHFDLKLGDEVVLAFASGNKQFSGMPLLKRFKIGGTISHGVYEKDMRIIYIGRKVLQEILRLGGKANILSFNIPTNVKKGLKDSGWDDYRWDLKEKFGPNYQIKTYWQEFSPLIRAVEHEKFMIGLILQIIVIISIFNVIAFIIFLNEKKAQELFLFKALGLGPKRVFRYWMGIILFFWGTSCLLSVPLVSFFNYALGKFSLFQLPDDIYHLKRLQLSIGPEDYTLVFFLSLIWILLISWFVLRRFRKRSILEGLRKEFA